MTCESNGGLLSDQETLRQLSIIQVTQGLYLHIKSLKQKEKCRMIMSGDGLMMDNLLHYSSSIVLSNFYLEYR